MAPSLKSALKYVFSGILTVLFLYLAFRGTDVEQLVESLKKANYWWMLLMLGVLMVSHGFRALRWRYLLEPIRANIGVRNLFSAVMIGYFMNNILPRAGEIVRPYSLSKLETLPKSAAFGTIVVERILDTMSFLLLLLVLPLLYNGPLRESFPWLAKTGFVTACVAIGAMGGMTVLVFRRDLADTILGRVEPLLPKAFAGRLDKIMHSFLDGFLFVKRPGNFVRILVLSAVIWFLYVVMTYVAFYAFDLQSSIGFGAAVVVLTISSIGVAVPTPGSTGTYHFFTSQTLVKLFSISDPVALSYATVTHAVGFFGTTCIGLYFLLRDHIKVSEAVQKPEAQAG